MLRCPRLPAAAAASTLRALVPHAHSRVVCPALSSVLQLPRRLGATSAPAGSQPHPSLAGLSLRALSLSAPAAHSEKVPGTDEPQPGHNSSGQPAPPQTRVVGKRMAIGEDFLETSNRGGFIVDKTLTCKALLESPDKAVRICLPRRFGKTFNLSVIAQFFNPVTVHDCLGGAGESHFKEAHGRRRTLFCGSLLEKRYPEFVEENFAKTPVIQIDFKNSDGESLGLFNKSLAR
ncbi:hypothetical protein IWQ56_007383, partial [Coemansia nantahalensis]